MLNLTPNTHLDQIDFLIPGKGSIYCRRPLGPMMSNGPAMPPITAAVQTPVVGACGISRGSVKANAVEGQAKGAGLSRETERMNAKAKKKRGE